MTRRHVLPFVLLSCFAVPAASAAPQTWIAPKEALLPDDYMPVTPAQRALTSVPFAPGAPAVVLFEGSQDDVYHRRVKILTPGGVSSHSDFRYGIFGKVKVRKALARTILPDGTIVDASSDVHVELPGGKSGRGLTTVSLAFPRVEVGAILDLLIETDDYGISRVAILQESIPVLEKRIVVRHTYGLSALGRNMPPEAARPQSFSSGEGDGFAWTFRDLPPLPAVPFRPPVSDIAQQLVFSYRISHDAGEARAWKEWAGDAWFYWNEWMKGTSNEARSLAKQLGAGKPPREAAEAMRLALRDRLSVLMDASWGFRETPDEVLKEGGGTSADVAGLLATMLRSQGIEASLAAYRRRDSGRLPKDLAVPGLLNGLLVGIPEASGTLWFSPTADVAVGRLPYEARGVEIVPFVKKSDGPVVVSPLTAADNRTTRVADVTLDAAGKVAGEVTITWSGLAADDMRAELREATEDERKEILRAELSAWMPGARLLDLTLGDLGVGSDALDARLKFEADAQASAASRRLLLSPMLFSRVRAEDWAAETREIPLDFDAPSEEQDTIVLRVPEDLESITLPQPMKLTATPVGEYESGYAAEGTVVTVRRRLRLDMSYFPAASYAGLRPWFQDMAAADDQPLVLKFSAPEDAAGGAQ